MTATATEGGADRPIQSIARVLGRTIRATVAAGLLAALAACSGVQDNVFVLMENPDGTVGQIEVSNEQGSQTIDQPGQSVGLDRADSAPSAPAEIDDKAVQDIFGTALAAEPEPPANYVLYFKIGAAELTAESEALLPEVLSEVSRRTAPSVSVVGHTDRLGADEFNAKLALNRAKRVHDILVESGLDSDLIEVTSHGEANPLIATPDGVSEPRNRRVEITVR